MNFMEKQAELGKSLYEINTSAMSHMFELSRKNIEQYVETNRAFGEKLPEVREISAFFNLQREYGETLWNNARIAVEAQNELLTGAFNDTREAITTAFTTTEAPAPKKAPAKKAKAEAA
jgi:dsDNA-binding SOS-regulon protein